MNILVCFKILPEPDRVLEEDWRNFDLKADLGYAGLDFNCFDRSALEIGLKIKEQAAVQGAEALCTALTVAPSAPGTMISGLYAAGCDRVVCLEQQDREFRPRDTASLISGYAEKLGADLIICGKAAGMAETGLVPYMTALNLGMPLISDVESGGFEDGHLKLLCRGEDGLREMKAGMPAVCAVGNSPEVLRLASLRARMKCRGMEAEMVSTAALPTLPAPELFRPDRSRKCEMLSPEDCAERILNEFRDNSAESGGSESTGSILSETSGGSTPADPDGRTVMTVLRSGSTELMLFEDSASGRAAAAETAYKNNLPCLFGVHITEIGGGRVLVQKPVCAANLIWKKELQLPAVLTLSRRELSEYSGAEHILLPERDNAGFITEEKLISRADGSALGNAETAVICGAGMGSKRNCDRARLLAEKLGAGFGLTRPAALNVWGKPSEIVGLSGSVIAPRCCLVLGAAGAGAFAAGIENAGKIISVNTDSDALIFRNSDMGVQTDAAALTEKLLSML